MAQNMPRGGPEPDGNRVHRETLAKIRKLQVQASRGLWILAVFLATAIAASRGFDLLPALPAEARRWLGPAPPERLIQIALVVYAFCATVLILSRMAAGHRPGRAISHLGYLLAFFAFFHFAGVLQENFWAVLVAGSMVLGLNAFHDWTYAGERVREEEENLARIERRTGDES